MRKIRTELISYRDGILQLQIPKEERAYFEKVFVLACRHGFCFYIKAGQKRLPRSVYQNYLLWGLLGDYAAYLTEVSGERVTAEMLYYEAVSRYGVNVFYMIPAAAEKDLGAVGKFMERIDTQRIWDGKCFRKWVKLKAVYGSSEYDTEEMNRVIHGVADEMERIGISSDYVAYVKEMG